LSHSSLKHFVTVQHPEIRAKTGDITGSTGFHNCLLPYLRQINSAHARSWHARSYTPAVPNGFYCRLPEAYSQKLITFVLHYKKMFSTLAFQMKMSAEQLH
jgi:hypothetical protein